jgi:HD-GYP domain-containing protein (c-di-GMP phosphodiesterase class II)
MSHANAVEELRRNTGTQFDPRVVEALLDVLKAAAPSGTSLSSDTSSGSCAYAQ